MSETDYAGIDYSLGKSNINHETGIHYGVISIHEVLQAWSDSSEPFYVYTCPHCGSDLKKGVDAKRCNSCYKKIDSDRDFDNLEPSSFYYNQDSYECEQGNDDTDIFILKSPYYTYCQFASPCAPGAGYIMSWMDKDKGIKAYCFGHDWFDSQPTGKEIECHYCEGKGKRVYPEHSSIYNNGALQECHNCFGTGKVLEYIQKAPYPVYDVKTGKEIKS